MATIDEPDGQGSNGSAPTTDEPARTVAEEAALLVELLSRRGWGAGGGMPSAPSHTHRTDGGGWDRDDRDGPHEAHGADATDATGTAEAADAPDTAARPGGIPLGDRRQRPECTCGGREPAACRICPVCQLISFVQQVNPDTIERVADFVGFAATALRDLAAAQRERSERPKAPTPASSPPGDQTQPTGTPEAARDGREGPA